MTISSRSSAAVVEAEGFVCEFYFFGEVSERRRDKTEDAVGRPRRESSLLGDPSANFFCGKRETGTKKDETGKEGKKRRTQRAGQDFFQAVVHSKTSARRIVIALRRPPAAARNPLAQLRSGLG